MKEESEDDSDYLPIEDPQRRISSDEEFKPTKISPRGPKLGPGIQLSTSKKRIDRRVLSSDDDTPKNRNDVWCEIFVEELEQWIAVDVINGKVHCTGDLYVSMSLFTILLFLLLFSPFLVYRNIMIAVSSCKLNSVMNQQLKIINTLKSELEAYLH